MRWFFSRVQTMVRGGNPLGVGEYTLMAASGPGRA
jgi:hypothetical protein